MVGTEYKVALFLRNILDFFKVESAIPANNKFAESLEYLKKKVWHEVDFLCRQTSEFSLN